MVFRELLSNTKNKQRSVNMIRTLELQGYLRKQLVFHQNNSEKKIANRSFYGDN